jgi:hypothetical protein
MAPNGRFRRRGFVNREVVDPGDSDSIAFAAGARLVLSDPQHLYVPQAQERVEASLLHIPPADHFLAPFTNIAAGALILSPLSSVDLATETSIVVVISTVLFAFALLLMRRLLAPVSSRPMRLAIAAATMMCIPAVEAVVQWDSLLTVALLGSVLLAERRRYGWAGLLLATLVLKPQVVWLVVPAVVAARSWRYLGGLVLGCAVWLAVSTFIAGPAALVALAQLIGSSYPGQAGIGVGIPSLISAATGNGVIAFIAAGGLGVIAAAGLLSRRELFRGRPLAAVAIGVSLSLLCSPHVSLEDLMLLTVPVAFIARTWPKVALGEALAISAAELVQLQFAVGDRHLQPVVLAIIASSAVLALLPPRDLASPVPTHSASLQLTPVSGAIGGLMELMVVDTRALPQSRSDRPTLGDLATRPRNGPDRDSAPALG